MLLRLPSLLCFAALLCSAACAEARPPPARPPPPVAVRSPDSKVVDCPAPLPSEPPIGEGTPAAGAHGQVSITFKNEMSGFFGLQRMLFVLDRKPICMRPAPTDRDPSFINDPAVRVFSGAMPEGDHLLELLLVYIGRNRYSIYSYLRAYKSEVRSSHTFHVDQGKGLRIEVIGYEKGGPTTPLEERPAVRFEPP